MKRWMLTGMSLAIAMSAPLSLLAQEAPKPAPKAKPAARAAAAPAAAPAVPVDPSALLKAVPDDATAFIAVGSLKQLDQNVQDTAKALGLPPGTVPSLVQWIKGSLKLGKDFNENGSMAAVVLSLSDVKTTDEVENRLVLLFPASNPKGLAESMGGKTEGEVTKLELAGEPAFAGPRGDFLAVAKNEAAIKSLEQAKGPGLIKTISPERAQAFAKQDIFAWANFRGVSKELRQSIREELTKNAGPGTPLAGLAGTFDQLNQIFEEGQDLALGLSLNPKRGINLNFYISMRPGTEKGKEIADMKPASGSLLVGLPAGSFVAAAGTVASPDAARQLKRVFDAMLSDEKVGEKVDKEKLGQVRDGLARLVEQVQQISLGVYPLAVEDGQGMINLTLVAKVKDAEQWNADARKLFAIGKDFAVETAKKEGGSEDKVKQVANAIQWKENAEKLGGSSVDHLSVDLAKLPDVEAESVDQVKKVLGPEGILLRVGSLGKDKVVVNFGGGAKRYEAIAKAAAANEAPLEDNADVKKVAERLPRGPKVLEGYLNVDRLISLVMDISNEVGGGLMFPIALRNAAPLAIQSVKVGETAQQTEILVPMELLRSVADIVRPMLQMGLGGGSQPGDSDTPEPPPGGSELK